MIRPFLYPLLLIGLLFLKFEIKGQERLNYSITEFWEWTPKSTNRAHIPHEPLQKKHFSPDKLKTGKLLLAPDNMTGFSRNEDSLAIKFNYFNFTHWQYIDIINTFGGSWDRPIVRPSKEWINASHKNGVEIIGTVCFLPQDWGGDPEFIREFLTRDENGEFKAIQKLIEMAETFHFDGWLIHFETHVNTFLAFEIQRFLVAFKKAYSGELIWYDSMLQLGNVAWQNQLNERNVFFLKQSTGFFTNYWWGSSDIKTTLATAKKHNLDPYDVYTGMDLWPDRPAQNILSQYGWIELIFEEGVPQTSIALFAANYPYNAKQFSNFQTDPSDYRRFYMAERQLFAGIDGNPFQKDSTWKGFGYFLPASTVITELPFSTSFNTGHGLQFFHQGELVHSGPWFNLNLQDILPTWPFQNQNLDSIEYDFEQVFTGGNSVRIESKAPTKESIPLFKTNLPVSGELTFEWAIKSAKSDLANSLAMELKTSKGTYHLPLVLDDSENWQNVTARGLFYELDTILGIGLSIHSEKRIKLNIGAFSMRKSFEQTNRVIGNGTSRKKLYQLLINNPSLSLFNLNGDPIRLPRFLRKRFIQKLPPGVYLTEFFKDEDFEKTLVVLK